MFVDASTTSQRQPPKVYPSEKATLSRYSDSTAPALLGNAVKDFRLRWRGVVDTWSVVAFLFDSLSRFVVFLRMVCPFCWDDISLVRASSRIAIEYGLLKAGREVGTFFGNFAPEEENRTHDVNCHCCACVFRWFTDSHLFLDRK